MPAWVDGPASPLFRAAPWSATGAAALDPQSLDAAARRAFGNAPQGDCVAWGIPFQLPQVPWRIAEQHVTFGGEAMRGRWLVFQHASEVPVRDLGTDGIEQHPRGAGRLAEHAADYVLIYEDGGEVRLPVRRRLEVGMWMRTFGDPGVACVSHRKPRVLGRLENDSARAWEWGTQQTQVTIESWDEPAPQWLNWLWAVANPRPQAALTGFRAEPVNGTLYFFGLSVGDVEEHPLRWQPRRRLRIRLGKGVDPLSLYRRTRFGNDYVPEGADPIDLDLGRVIRVFRPRVYPDAAWAESTALEPPAMDPEHAIVEFAAHPQARLQLAGESFALADLPGEPADAVIESLPAPTQRVLVRVVEAVSRRPVAAKLHMHSADGQYFAPEAWNREPNPYWFQDHAPDTTHYNNGHLAAYIPGEATAKLPWGQVFVEASKGFEFRPVRQSFDIGPGTERIEVEVGRALRWHERGWYTSDTHVHFVSPTTGLLEGAAEDVHLVNLLAAQWGELKTNVGDFDGKTLHRYEATAADADYHLWVGTENRQRVLGHISLLTYEGPMVTPLSTAGPIESALGTPVENTLTGFAAQARAQNGIVVLPHFPHPRLENAAALVGGLVDGVEMCAFNPAMPIDPYSLVDWYRYLNCGYAAAIVGGTDKMAGDTPIGALRTYANLGAGEPFTVAGWREAIRQVARSPRAARSSSSQSKARPWANASRSRGPEALSRWRGAPPAW